MKQENREGSGYGPGKSGLKSQLSHEAHWIVERLKCGGPHELQALLVCFLAASWILLDVLPQLKDSDSGITTIM